MKYFFLIILILISLFLAWINYSLVYRNTDPSGTVTDVYMQMNFLENELKNNRLSDKMQEIYPEGYIFINTLYGLAWCELALADPRQDTSLKNKALNEALFAYEQVNSERAKLPFDKSLYPECGMYYFGWKNYLLSKILLIDTAFAGHEILINEYNAGCYAIKQLLNERENPYIHTYPGNTWPADMFTAVASLKNFDRIFGNKYDAEIRNWIMKVRADLDPMTGMIPHKVNSVSGLITQNPRGSSMSLTLRLLAEIDTVFAAEQYILLEQNFVSSVLGIPYLREYPTGVDGKGDVDSGPVIFGIGFSGTIVMIGTYASLGYADLSEKQYRTINTFGYGTTSGDKKMYILGKYPMADAFIAWGIASGLKNIAVKKNKELWLTSFNVLSLFLIILLWTLFFRKIILKHNSGRPY